MYKQKTIKISDLHVNNGQVVGLPKNPRFIKDDRFEALKKSISDSPEMLELREIIAYDNNGEYVVIGGNMRLRAMKELGIKTAPCKILDANTPIEKLREYTIKDNIAFGQNDWDVIANEWDENELTEWGMELADWDNETQEDNNQIRSSDVEEDDFSEEDENSVVARVKRGDIWKCGEHLIMCGDSTSPEDLSKLMDGELADLWLTDPPYNVNYEGGTKEALKIKNDNMDNDSFRQFLNNAFSCAVSSMKEGASFYIWHADSEGYNFRGACFDSDLQVRQCIIWNKNSLVLGRQDYQWKHEPCLYGWKGGAAHKWYSDRSQSTVINFDRPSRNSLHPTMKPVGLFAYLIENSSKKGDLVLDSFGGSGTTMIACEQMGRKARVMELDEHYCDVIISRWEKLTGSKSEKIK